MDDDLVLNIATEFGPVPRKNTGTKGGRWTDRLKANRVVKRKRIIDDVVPHSAHSKPVPDSRPSKRPRTDTTSRPPSSKSAPKQQSQVISSLFTSNPRVLPLPVSTPQVLAKPSNAPLNDSSAFAGLGLDPLIVSHLSAKMSVLTPTAIQRSALPILLSSAETMASRDVFIQSQTGSGKTLAFLLPILQDLLPLSRHSYIDRSIGTLAVIIAPTRELAKQISDVLESLLQLRLRPKDEAAEDADTSSARLTRWLVSGLLTGGATRTHEKARLRKGVPILVSTPGRLLDHLQNTSSFNIGKCRWLVLDEADRLMELGFEETITGIIQGLDGRRRLALQAVEEGKSTEVGGWDWERRRRTVLCSATIGEDVQKLAGNALANPLMIKATEVDRPRPEPSSIVRDVNTPLPPPVEEKFTPPSQLSQKYVIAPLKLRLVALVALLRSLITQSGSKGTRIIVFLSCTDSVDFHWNLLGKSTMDGDSAQPNERDDEDDASDDDAAQENLAKENDIELECSLLPDTSIYRLHGSLSTQLRQASIRGFAGGSKAKPSLHKATSSVLLCTSVASRGLDLPLVRAVIQYDLPTEGGATEYVHRVGRTARAGKGGEAWSLVAPSESAWVEWIEAKLRGEDSSVDKESQKISLSGVTVDSILKGGFGGKPGEHQARATEVQLSFERWILHHQDHANLARQAFLSHIRAYATHPSNEKHMFHVRHLHLGHLAKSFALREAPNAVSNSGKKVKTVNSRPVSKRDLAKEVTRKKAGAEDWDIRHSGEAEKRMKEVVRSQGKLSKHKGVMMSSGASEFQIAGGETLERLVGSRI